eukprot:Hpha_TRINITY_DN30723_c0_g1::TRINITY_DN30723_c0_g1_i1::g.28297::m.28297
MRTSSRFYRAAVQKAQCRRSGGPSQSPNQYIQFQPSSGAYAGGTHGPGSAPPSWGKSGIDKMERRGKEDREGVKEGADLRPRHWHEMDGDQSGKARFKVVLEQKTQAQLDAEEEADKVHLPNLTEAQRKRIRARKLKAERWERLVEVTHSTLRPLNFGRRNAGILNRGDWNIGLLCKGDKNRGFLCFGDHNKGVLLFGNDNRGFLCLGSGNVGALIFGDQNRGVDLWGNKMNGICQSEDKYAKIRLRVSLVLMAVFIYAAMATYSGVREKRTRSALRLMDMDDGSVDAIRILRSRKDFQ